MEGAKALKLNEWQKLIMAFRDTWKKIRLADKPLF